MNYVYQNYLTPELENYLSSKPDLLKFARELHHTFGLYVYGGDDYIAYMCNVHGVHVAEIWAESSSNDKGDSVVEYHYKSPWYVKARGSSDSGRRTLTSVKLSSLIATLKRHKVIPSTNTTLKVLVDRVDDFRNNIQNSTKVESRKSMYDVDIDAYHAMLKIILRNESESLLLRFDRAKLEATLQSFDLNDKAVEARTTLVNERLYSGDMYGVGVGRSGDYLVAKFRVTSDPKSNSSANVLEIKRVKSLKESYEQFIPILTMYKVANENNEDMSRRSVHNNDQWLIPRTDKYDADMDINFAYAQPSDTASFIQWVVFPCSAT